MALCSLLPFESFQDVDETMVCYIKESDFSADVMKQFSDFLKMFNANYTDEVIPPQNWNAVWESNFKPVEIDQFCRIRADFHPSVSGFEYEIRINPKMAFGTGHHETTFMMIQQMEKLSFKNMDVLDYGCGTGILAILAKKLGAKLVVGVDIEEESYSNTIENSNLNQTTLDKVYCGTLSSVVEQPFNIILANINRNVLLDTCDEVVEKLASNGYLLLSGILLEDFNKVYEKYSSQSLNLVSKAEKGKWNCLLFQK